MTRPPAPDGAIVAIDPGYAKRGHGCAVAFFDRTGVLYRATFMRPEHVRPDPLRVRGLTAVVWECPQVDRRTYGATPATVQLAAVGGTLAGMFAGANGVRATPVTPAEWKGSTPKPVSHARMWRTLSDVERAVLGGDIVAAQIRAAQLKGARDRWRREGAAYYPSTWHEHNLLDAVGIGVWRQAR